MSFKTSIVTNHEPYILNHYMVYIWYQSLHRIYAFFFFLKGDHLVVANAGDSRAVIATTSDDGNGLVPVQLSVDFKPSIPGILLQTFTYLQLIVQMKKDSIKHELTICM